jgi:hypothetical protein
MAFTGSAQRLWKGTRGRAIARMSAAVYLGVLLPHHPRLGDPALLVRLLPAAARAVPGHPALLKRCSIRQSLLRDASNQQLDLPPRCLREDPD